MDIGTATGTLGRMCQDIGFELDGIEPNPEWAEVARPYYNNLMVVAVEDAPDESLRGYQVVICADVLEHMASPEAALQRLISLQPDGCIFLVSVPNVANLWVRLNLLFGKFEYTDRGILDRTHLRFFTRKTFMQLIQSAGLTVNRIHITPIPINLIFPRFYKHRMGRLALKLLDQISRWLPTVLGYQFLVEAVKIHHE